MRPCSFVRVSILRAIRSVAGVYVLCTFRIRRRSTLSRRPAQFKRPTEETYKVADPAMAQIALDARTPSDAAVAPGTLQPNLDPIGCDFNLPLKSLFHPLGFPVEIATNCADVLAAANENWKLFHEEFAVRPVQLRIAVSKEQTSQCPPPPTCRGQRNLVMFVASAHDFAVCDLSTGFASCWLAESTMGSSAYVRYHFLDAM